MIDFLHGLCTFVGAWFLVACAICLAGIGLRAAIERWLTRRCCLCRVGLAAPYPSRFGQVCVGCYDAITKLYHRRPRRDRPRGADYPRPQTFDGDGWRNG